jgi:hypothetical protein
LFIEAPMRVRTSARLVAALAATLVGGCDGSTGTDGSFTMSLSSGSATVGQGGSTTITVTFTRADLDAPITLAAEGLPTGVTATFSPNPASGATSIIQFSAAASTAPGASAVTIRATAEGAAEQTATLDLSVSVTGDFTLGALNSTLTVAQGGGDRTSILVNRTGGFGGSVAIALSGAPSGLTPVLEPASTSGNSVLLSLAASQSLAVGTYTLTATGTSAGVGNQQATITVNVIAAPAVASLTMTFCSTNVPAFFAYKNEGSPWQTAAATGSAFTFDATDRLAVATVFLSATQSSKQVNVSYGVRSEFASFQGRDCSGTKSVTGSVAGLSSAQQARIALGPLSASPAPTSSAPNFSFSSLPDRVIDLIGVAGIGSSGFFTPDKVIVRRNLNPAGGAVLPTLDFAAAEAFAPQSGVLTIGTIGATDSKTVAVTFWTANNAYGQLQFANFSAGTLTYYGVPQAQQVAGEVHEIYVDQFVQQSQVGRSLVSYFAAPGDRTESVGPFVNTPLVTTIATTPYLRLRGRLDAQTEYGSAARILFYQEPAANDSRGVYLQVSALYLGGAPTTWDISVPDLSGLTGFTPAWMPVAGAPTLWQVIAFGGRAELLSDARPASGDFLRYSDRTAVISTPALRAEGGRPALPRSQYFRR